MSQHADLLVVDDEPVLLGAVRKVIAHEGLSMHDADSTAAGLQLLSAGNYRLVLTDLMLPGDGGMQLLEVMRREHPRTPVVVITGYATAERTAGCFGSGAFDVVPKPFDISELLAVIRRALGFGKLDNEARRSVDLAEFVGRCGASHGATQGLWSLGQHAWVSLESNGTVRIGVAENFRPLDGALRGVELPALETDLLQGNECAGLSTDDGMLHRVRAPLSGRVVEINAAWRGDRPPGAGLPDSWLIAVEPAELERELGELTRR